MASSRRKPPESFPRPSRTAANPTNHRSLAGAWLNVEPDQPAAGQIVPIAAAWIFGGVATVASVLSSARATTRGLAGATGGKPRSVRMLASDKGMSWLGDALYRKELLWFWRDRGAVVQAILIPMSVAAFQLINLRRLLESATHQWHWLCTISVVFGTYFLFILGPRSLISEGAALWPCVAAHAAYNLTVILR